MEDFNIDEMRQQMAILQNKLDNQTIVNDRIIRRAVKHGVSTINKRYLIIGLVALAMIPYGYWAFVKLAGMSMMFWIASCVMMLAVVGFMIFNSYEISKKDFANGNLLDAKRKVAVAKKRDSIWPFFAVPVVLGWAAWGGWEMGKKMDNIDYFIPFFIICVTLGAIMGLIVHFKTQRHYRDIIEQIEDLEDDK